MTKRSGSYSSRILKLLEERGVLKTACPSEILPVHLKKSPKVMSKVREASEKLARQNKIEILRNGKPVEPGSQGPIRLKLKPRISRFNSSLNFKRIDFRKNPGLYEVGKGEQGVLLVEPYKSEILPYWRFATPAVAKRSAKKIYGLFKNYGRRKDFIGMDMARKFLQMGMTRSGRYANHKSGKKYIGPVPVNKKGQSGSHGRAVAELDIDPLKAQCAKIFRQYLKKAKTDRSYVSWLSQRRFDGKAFRPKIKRKT